MLPERLSGYLTALARLAEQPTNRWDGFDLSDPDSRTASLRDQIGFAGLALGALARHPAADPAECERARNAVAALARRLAQRRVWAAWATVAERAARLPDPVGEGNAGYTGMLAALLSLAELLGCSGLDEPLTLRWSSDFCFSYTAQGIAELLWRQARAHPDGAVASSDDTAHPHEMAHVLWALRLADLAFGGERATAGEPWLRALGERLALRGPRLPGRGALAGSYQLRRRSASLVGDRLTDAWTLALVAPLAPDLAEQFLPRHWAQSRRVEERGTALELGFDYLLAVECGKGALATQLPVAADERFAPLTDAEGRRYTGAPAAPWLTALIALGEAGGLGLLAGGSAAKVSARGI